MSSRPFDEMCRSANNTDLSLECGPAGRTGSGDVPIRQVRRHRMRMNRATTRQLGHEFPRELVRAVAVEARLARADRFRPVRGHPLHRRNPFLRPRVKTEGGPDQTLGGRESKIRLGGTSGYSKWLSSSHVHDLRATTRALRFAVTELVRWVRLRPGAAVLFDWRSRRAAALNVRGMAWRIFVKMHMRIPSRRLRQASTPIPGRA